MCMCMSVCVCVCVHVCVQARTHTHTHCRQVKRYVPASQGQAQVWHRAFGARSLLPYEDVSYE